jgi:hypothetical protein
MKITHFSGYSPLRCGKQLPGKMFRKRKMPFFESQFCIVMTSKTSASVGKPKSTVPKKPVSRLNELEQTVLRLQADKESLEEQLRKREEVMQSLFSYIASNPSE